MSASVGFMPNGILPAGSHRFAEVDEYTKILKLRDQVFAGRHPRLGLTNQIRNLATQQSPRHSVSTLRPHVDGQESASAPAVSFSGPQDSSTRDVPTTHIAGHQVSKQHTTSEKNVTSEFDPVLLTKPDVLLRAEAQLKRQRLEKLLRDQFEQKRLDTRKKPAPSEAKPDFDVASLLARALELTKTTSLREEGSASESFDENSFYSSRAPDSTPEGGGNDTSSTQHRGSVGAVDVDADGLAGPHARSAVMGSPLFDSNIRGQTSPARRSGDVDMTNIDADDESEEGEYSPPEAMEQYPTPHEADSQAAHDSRDPRSRPLRRYSELEATSPNGAARTGGKLRRDRPRFLPTSPHQSHDDPQNHPPKKKRKLDKRNDNKKNRRYGGLSPDTFIKEEKISPPPFHEVQPLGSGRVRPPLPSGPIVIEDDYPPTRERYVDSPLRQPPRVIEQAPLSEPRQPSYTNMRPLRDEHDLRRVASMQAMRAEPVREAMEPLYDSPVRMRAASYVRGNSPSIREYDRLPASEMRAIHSPALSYREPPRVLETPRPIYEAREMAPPPTTVERIVVDQYGRRFREIVRTDPVPAVPQPRAVSVRPGDGDGAIYEAYRPQRSSSSVYVDAISDNRYAQEMPPPRIVYRSTAEPTRMSSMAPPPGPEYYEPPVSHRSSSVQVLDRSVPREEYVNSRSGYAEPVRLSSARSSAPQYDDIRGFESVARQQSVQPSPLRERSVYVDDQSQSQPRYRLVEPEQRYLDPQGREVIMVDNAREPVSRRYVERY